MSRTTFGKETNDNNFGHKSCVSDIMDPKGGRDVGTLLTFGQFHRDQCPVHGFSKPIAGRPHINFVMWELWDEGKENVPVGSRPLI